MIELGQEGEWDAGWISPVNLPLEVEDELWFYYSGGATTIGFFEEWIRTPMFTGLTTIPLKATGWPLQLEINAQGLSGSEGRIVVELLEGGKVAARSSAVIRDGLEVPVRWPHGGKKLSLPSGESLQLRFQLERKARLYSFTFK